MLAVWVSFSLLLLGVPLGRQSVHVAAADEPMKTVTPITVPLENLDDTGEIITKWKLNNDVYETQNQGQNSTACTMEVPITVDAGYAELEFDWKVSSEAEYDFLGFELKGADGTVLQSDKKFGMETEFNKVVLKLDNGNYTLTFTYEGDANDKSGGGDSDTGYVKNLNLVTYRHVTTIAKTMFATREDLTNSENFSLATNDHSKVGKITFGTRPQSEIKYYKYNCKTPNEVKLTGKSTPINWLIAGGEKFTPEGSSDETDGLVLYSEEPLIGAYYLRDKTNTNNVMNSRFRYDTYVEIDYKHQETYGEMPGWVGTSSGGKTSFPASDSDSEDWGTYPDNNEDGKADNPDHVYANHWGASNLRKVLHAIYEGSTLIHETGTANYSGFFTEADKALMSTSKIKTNDYQFNTAVQYTTEDVLYAPRCASYNDEGFSNCTSVTVGSNDTLTIEKTHWGGMFWLRSPNPKKTREALITERDGQHCIDNTLLVWEMPAISAAFRLDLSTVLFTSAASAASLTKENNFEAISANTPMTLRVDGTASGKPLEGIDAPTVQNGAITYNTPEAGARLMVLATGDDGTTYQYFKSVDEEGTLKLESISSTLPKGKSYTMGAWLEVDDPTEGSTITYATPATDEFTCCTNKTIALVAEEVPATCVSTGKKAYYKCSVCGQLFSDANGENPIDAPVTIAIDANAHSWGEWVPTMETTCTQVGEQIRTCSHDLNHIERKWIPALEHDWSEWVPTKTATCTENGEQTRTCTRMPDNPHTETETITALGHDWSDWVTTTQPTCTEKGKQTRTCKRDDSHTENMDLDATGHNASGAWQTDETHHWKICDTCKDEIEKAEHDWNDGTVTTQPTTSAPGVITYTCSVCGETKTQEIPMLDDDEPDWGTPEIRSADGKTQYVDSAGRTSIEISSDNLDNNSILWLREKSDGTSAWYGIDLSKSAFELDKGHRFYVQWLSPNEAAYTTYYSQLDDEHKARVKGDNGWLFLIGVLDQDDNSVQPSEAVKMYVQIGDDWDLNGLQGYYIASGADEKVPVEGIANFSFPEGTDEFGVMTLSHFSPYFIFDELTNDGKTTLGTLPITGDISTELLTSGFAIVLISSLIIMLRLITNKRIRNFR